MSGELRNRAGGFSPRGNVMSHLGWWQNFLNGPHVSTQIGPICLKGGVSTRVVITILLNKL